MARRQATRAGDAADPRAPPTDAGKRKRESAPAASEGNGADADAESALLALAGLGGAGDKRRKWTRVLLRELYDLGYSVTAAALEHEANVQLRSESVRQLQAHVAAREWDRALRLVGYRGSSTTTTAEEDDEGEDDDVDAPLVRMQSEAATRDAVLVLLRCKFLDQLATRQLRAALATLHREILPAFPLSDAEKNALAMLLLCREERDAERVAAVPWRASDVLACIEQLASPDEIIPSGALGRLVRSSATDAAGGDTQSAVRAMLSGECVAILLRHSSEVLGLRFSPDGAFLASSARDGQVIIWEMAFSDAGRVQIPKALHVFRCAHGAAECLAWSPDSQSLLTCGSESRVIEQWNIPSGECWHEFHHPADGVTSVQWLPSGRQFLSGAADKSLLLWNVADGSIAYQWGGRRVLDMAMHPDGKRAFVLISGVEIRVYDLESKADELFFRAEELVSCISLAPSGKFLLVNLIRDEKIVCLEVDTGLIVATYSGLVEQRYVLRPCFGGHGDELVACGSEDAKVYVWHRESSGGLALALTGHSSAINTVESHPGRPDVLASASDDETIRLWAVKGMEQRAP